MDAIAESHHARRSLEHLVRGVHDRIVARGAHPARTVVLMPFAHLLQPARDAWGRCFPAGFVPRFETTSTWAAVHAFEPAVGGFTGDAARDVLTARALVEAAGFAAHAELLAPRLVEAARQLVPVAMSVEPSERARWAHEARRAVGFDAPALAHESAVASIAVEWLAVSTFSTDRLFEDVRAVDLLAAVQALRDDRLTDALLARLEGKSARFELPVEGPRGQVLLQAAADPSDEAERAAAAVVSHVRDGRVPVALAAIDRLLTRRIRALLDEAGAAVRDETGWTLSTTRAAAHVMTALRACSWNAGADAVIDWLKNSPAHAPGAVLALEARARRAGVREWRSMRAGDLKDGMLALFERANAWREEMQAARPLLQWIEGLHTLLLATGQWARLERDAAGLLVAEALRLSPEDRDEFAAFEPAARRMTLAEFTAWAGDAMEAGSFKPAAVAQADVVILPLEAIAGREFAALVAPGCDEVRLQVSEEPPGLWTPSQRESLGLPSRAALEAAKRLGWRIAMQTPRCDLLWRVTDESGEPVLPSVLVQELQLEGAARIGADARGERVAHVEPAMRPAPSSPQLAVTRVSASAYEDLRKCPYRFFALRQLGLQEPDEIDVDLDKRDFGNWLHKVLSAFHAELARTGAADASARVRMLDDAAERVQREMRLDEGEFLPFRAGWPQVRDGYLEWLRGHEAEGAVFEESEGEHERLLAALTLFGRVDRIDRVPDGGRMVIDYKTEDLQVTQKRVKQAGEDTQLAFYAALLPGAPLRAAYVNVGERGKTTLVEQGDVIAARDLLVAGIEHDVRRIAQGEALPALGDGKACEYCAARGLCRKDFWS